MSDLHLFITDLVVSLIAALRAGLHFKRGQPIMAAGTAWVSALFLFAALALLMMAATS